jgi:DNA/RNA-binding domain of Phe-tRNA-synthetase-like protein
MTPAETIDERDSENDGSTDAYEVALKRWTNRTPEQKRIDREELVKRARKGRPLPEGKTIHDVLVGQWPGDETDEQIRRALEDLS